LELEHVQIAMTSEELESIKENYAKYLYKNSTSLNLQELKNTHNEIEFELLQNASDAELKELRLDKSAIQEPELEKSQIEGLLKLLNDYMDCNVVEKKMSETVLKIISDEVMNGLKSKNLLSKEPANLKLARKGLGNLDYLTLKTLPYSDRIYVKLFLNGVIDKEQLKSKSKINRRIRILQKNDCQDF
jgi:hypothetical protein